MSPSETLIELLDARDRLRWEQRKSTPSKREIEFLEELLEHAKRRFDEAVYIAGHK